MRRNGLLFGGWAVATLLALALGLQSIHSVSDSVTSPRPAPLSPASVREALHRNGSSSSSSTAVSTKSSADAASASTESTLETEIIVPGSDQSTSVPSSTPSTPTTSSSESTASSSDGGSDSSSSAPGSSSSSSSAPQERTFELVGGTVTIRFEDSAAHFVVATANSGFSVEHSESSGTVDVRFESSDHESHLRAWWAGEARWEIEENDG